MKTFFAISYLLLAIGFAQPVQAVDEGGKCIQGTTCPQGQVQGVGPCPAANQILCVPATEEDLVSGGLKGITGLLNLFGQGAGLTAGPQEPEVVAGKIILGFLLVIGVVFGILVIYGGYLWMTARGNEEQAKKAIGILETTIIGFIIVVGAYAITSYVVSRVIVAAFPPPPPQ